MKSVKLKRVTTFFLAFAIGVLPCLSNVAYAAEGDGIEPKNRNVEATDITKDISDKDFKVETCMEGIQFDEERETVTLSEITGEDGSEYKPDQPGTYYAKYLVVPKDGSEIYTIERRITLTDSEGQAHDESNGGDKQKEDTGGDAEEDSHTDEQQKEEQQTETKEQENTAEESTQKADVEITSLDPEQSEKELEQLEEDIENGNVLMMSAADGLVTRARETVQLVQGDRINYPSYLGSYSTCWFYVNGKLAYCLESHKTSPPTGDYVADVLESNKTLQKVLYYGYGGAGDITGSYLAGKSAEEKYVYTHLAASYAYAGDLAFTGCPYENLVAAGVIDYINHLTSLEEPPKGELSLSSTNVNAVREGDTQKTPDIKLNGDHRNYISIKLPEGVTGYNKTKGTNATGGSLKVYGGDTFYLKAPLTVTGNFESGSLYGSIRESWKTLVLDSTGSGNQAIGAFISESAGPVSFKVKWLNLARVQIVKKDAETKNPLDGAVYGVYKDSACTDLVTQISATGEDGTIYSDYFDAGLKTVYVKEIKAPVNYAINKTVYPVKVTAGATVKVEAEDKPVKGKITVNKEDVDTQGFVSQGDADLKGAVYGLYAKEDIQKPDGTGVLHKKGSLIQQKTFGESGEIVFSDVYLGAMYVKEITAPTGYQLDKTEYDATLTYEGQEKEIVLKELTVYEKVMRQAFQIIKISEDGEQTEVDLVKGAEFTVYLISELSEVKDGSLKPSNGVSYTAEDFIAYDFTDEKVATYYEDGEKLEVPVLITDEKGYAKSVELPYGQYVCVETKTPENLKQVNPFVVTVDHDDREPQQWRVFDDRPFEFLLKIIKKDTQTNRPVLEKSATYKVWDCEKEEYVEQVINYPEKTKISEFSTNDEGYLVLPQPLKAGHYRIEEIKAPDSYVRQGYEESLIHDGEEVSKLEITGSGTYEKDAAQAIELVINSDTPHQIDPDTGAYIVEVVQYNDEQVGSLTLKKVGEQLTEVKGESLLEKAAGFFRGIKDAVTGTESEDTGVFKDFVYEEMGVEGAAFELYAKDTIYSPDNAVDENGDRIIRYEKDDLVTTLITDEEGIAKVNNLPLGSYYLKETTAGEHFVLNPEQKEFTLTAENDTVAVVYENVEYKNERQKIDISVLKKDAVSKESVAGAVFGLYAGEDIENSKGEVIIEKDTLIEQAVSGEDGRAAFESDLWHGKYYVKEEQAAPGYLPCEEIWEINADYADQNEEVITLEKEIENQPTETHFQKTDIVTGDPIDGAHLQIIDKDGEVVREWTTKADEAEHIEYALPEGDYILREETAPYADGYVTAEEVKFSVKEDGSIEKVKMEDDISKVDISKTDLTTGEELEGATLQILDKDGNVLEEWVTNGEPHRIERLPVGEELILKETAAPDGYEIAEEVTFVVEDTMEVQKVEMKDARTTAVPKTGDNPLLPLALAGVCGASVLGIVIIALSRKKSRKDHAE